MILRSVCKLESRGEILELGMPWVPAPQRFWLNWSPGGLTHIIFQNSRVSQSAARIEKLYFLWNYPQISGQGDPPKRGNSPSKETLLECAWSG